MTEKKVAGQKTATIILCIVCIVLAIGLVIALVAYLPTTGQIDSLNAQPVGLTPNLLAGCCGAIFV